MRLAVALLTATLVFGGAPAWAAEPESRPVPTLLVGHLRVADQACLEAVARLPGITPDGSTRWAASELATIKDNLLVARKSTVDPKEQLLLEQLAAEAEAIRKDLRGRPGAAAVKLGRLRNAIRRFADEVQRRIELARREPVPVTRPALEP